MRRPTPLPEDYGNELSAAVDAVAKACRVARACRRDLVTEETALKKDRSPVTVADYSVQAIVSLHLSTAAPGIPMVAEEETAELATDAGAALRASTVRYVQSVFPEADEAAVLRAIGLGGHAGGPTGRFWTLDPIDGTKGFLRGGQYAIALALIDCGKVVAAALGCPNYTPGAPAEEGSGCILAAARSQGARLRSLDGSFERSVQAAQVAASSEAVVCESVEAAHSSHDAAAQIAERLGVTSLPVRIDSQCKYAAVALGDASIYLRLPTSTEYVEKIWDHAAGCLVVEEAGGKVTDVAGGPLDFSLGRTLRRNRGVVATNGRLHTAVLEAVHQTIGEQ